MKNPGLPQPPVATLTAELTANPRRWGEQGRFRDLLDRLGRETADPNEIRPDLDAVTVINGWRLVGIGHGSRAERELAMAVAERRRTHHTTRKEHR